MNVKNAPQEQIQGDMLVAIFNRQQELMEKYHDIEKNIGLMQTEDCPVNLHDKRGQARLKDFAWRATEEVAEAMETVPTLNSLANELDNLRSDNFDSAIDFAAKHQEIVQSLEDNQLHLKEELIDALHFFTEFTILTGLTPNTILIRLINNGTLGEVDLEADLLEVFMDAGRQLSNQDLYYDVSQFIIDLGLCCNCLKNKAWKQSSMLTDIPKFEDQVSKTWLSFMALLSAAGLKATDVADLYLKKSQVNKFRQRSNY